MIEKEFIPLEKENVKLGAVFSTTVNIEEIKKIEINHSSYENMCVNFIPAIKLENIELDTIDSKDSVYFKSQKSFDNHISIEENLKKHENQNYTSSKYFNKIFNENILSTKIEAFGEEIEVSYSISNYFNISYATKIKDIENNELREKVLSLVNQKYIDAVNKNELKIRENKKSKIQRKFDIVKLVYKKHGSKQQQNNLEDIDQLLYCEADTLIDDIIERFSKKNNAKNILMHKYYKELLDEEVITCDF